MRIIAEKTLKTYWEKEPLAQQQLVAWLRHLKEATFQNPNELKEQFRNASIIDDQRVVFNIHGNKYRLIVDFDYEFQLIFIIWFGTHKEYDRINVRTIDYTKPD